MNLNIEAARQQMIEQQIRAWEVLDEQVLDTIQAVRREQFVPAAYRELAFADTAIPLGHDQQMLTPQLEGKILQALTLGADDQVLEIGAGSGYLAACMAHLSARVRCIEIFPDIAERAVGNLRLAAVNNVTVDTADAMRLQVDGLYDAIAVTGSLPLWDERWHRNLKIGGRLFVVVGAAPIMEAWKITRAADGEWRREALFETVLPPLINASSPPAFVF